MPLRSSGRRLVICGRDWSALDNVASAELKIVEMRDCSDEEVNPDTTPMEDSDTGSLEDLDFDERERY